MFDLNFTNFVSLPELVFMNGSEKLNKVFMNLWILLCLTKYLMVMDSNCDMNISNNKHSHLRPKTYKRYWNPCCRRSMFDINCNNFVSLPDILLMEGSKKYRRNIKIWSSSRIYEVKKKSYEVSYGAGFKLWYGYIEWWFMFTTGIYSAII